MNETSEVAFARLRLASAGDRPTPPTTTTLRNFTRRQDDNRSNRCPRRKSRGPENGPTDGVHLRTLNDEGWFGEYWGLPTDIDLEVTDANGNVVSRSISFDNNYEIVDFEALGVAQPLQIRVKAFEGDRVKNETIAVAWYAWD